MTDPDEIVAILYEIGGRRPSNGHRPLRRRELEAPDPDIDPDHVDPADVDPGRDAYPSRRAAQAHRRIRGGGR